MQHLWTSLLFVFVFWGCSPEEKYANQLTEIERYTTKLDSIEKVISGIDFDSLAFMQETAESNEKIIERYFHTDTIDANFAKKLALNKSVKLTLKNILSQKEKMFLEVEELKNQFTNLRVDIINGMYDEAQIENYFRTEKQDTDSLLKSIDEFMEIEKIQRQYFYKSNEEVSKFATKLMHENQE